MTRLDSNLNHFPPEVGALIREGTEALFAEHFLYAANCFCLARHKLTEAGYPASEFRKWLADLHRDAMIFQGQAAAELR